MEEESIRDKNLRMMREILDARKYVKTALDKAISKNSKKNHQKVIKDTNYLSKRIKDSEGPDDVKDLF